MKPSDVVGTTEAKKTLVVRRVRGFVVRASVRAGSIGNVKYADVKVVCGSGMTKLL